MITNQTTVKTLIRELQDVVDFLSQYPDNIPVTFMNAEIDVPLRVDDITVFSVDSQNNLTEPNEETSSIVLKIDHVIPNN